MEQFNFKSFAEMTPADYERVGFKSGLEIHQQLLTKKKLFCRCPAGKFNKKYDAEILRHMRPTLSELGEYDGTALMEFKTQKEIIYQINRDSVCTYDMDDTPPFLMNEEALNIGLSLSMMYDSKIVDEIHIARKQYLDGSIPTGFQRTAIIALDGKVPFKDRTIEIIQLSIEEDSCREVSDIGHERVYVTDRLGMPLIETVTGPDMKTPQEVADVARICSNLFKSTGLVRTGAGAARQDVNVSVEGGTRIEIKGVSSISNIPLLTYHEALRQWNLLRLRDELNNRGINENTFAAESLEVTKLFKNPYYIPIKEALEKKLVIKCVVLKGFYGLLHWQTQTDTFFSREISDRVRVIACLTRIPNLIHSDSRGDTLTSSEWKKIKKVSGAEDNDTMVLVWGNEKDTDTATKEIIIRAREATIGVPSETRQALRDGTNGFERILPGAERMYPDTDLPPKRIESLRIKELKNSLPEKFWIREARYRKQNIPPENITSLAISEYAKLFEFLTGEWKINPTLASIVLIHFPKKLKKQGFDPRLLTEETFKGVFLAYKDGQLPKEGIISALRSALKLGKFYPELLPPPCTEKELENVVRESKLEIDKLTLHMEGNRNKLLIGRIMDKLRYRIDGSTVLNYLNFENAEEKN